MKLNETYKWQVELTDSRIITRDDVAKDKSIWEAIDFELICKVTFVPQLPLLPFHHAIIDNDAGEFFIKRFGRGFMKQTPNGFKLKEYIHCVVTNKYRLWVLSKGAVMTTHKDYEVYL